MYVKHFIFQFLICFVLSVPGKMVFFVRYNTLTIVSEEQTYRDKPENSKTVDLCANDS